MMAAAAAEASLVAEKLVAMTRWQQTTVVLNIDATRV